MRGYTKDDGDFEWLRNLKKLRSAAKNWAEHGEVSQKAVDH